jgi:hypothetical protein
MSPTQKNSAQQIKESLRFVDASFGVQAFKSAWLPEGFDD